MSDDLREAANRLKRQFCTDKKTGQKMHTYDSETSQWKDVLDLACGVTDPMTLVFQLDKDVLDGLQRLQEVAGLKTLEETIVRALRVYLKGGTIEVMRNDG